MLGRELERYGLANNQLAGYGYDAAGNMTHDATNGLNYSYDQENRITGANGFTYTYDDEGNRVEKSNGSTGTLYWYMTPGIVAESDLTGALTSEYVFFDGERVARKDFPSNAVSYYFSDHLKTTDIVTDAQGNIKNESDFYPWGGELQFSNNDSNHYKFTGKERDTETGLDDMGARYFGNALGRFMTPDAFFKDSHASDPQSWNEYGYVRNNPLRYVDPNGEAATISTNCTTTNDQTTCNVVISASIAIYGVPGSGLTQDQLNGAASTIQSSIQDAWSGSFQQEGVTYNVSTQISVQVAGSESAASATGAQNVVGLLNGPVSETANALSGRYSTFAEMFRGQDAGLWNYNTLGSGTGNTAAHEFTHLLGVGDKVSRAVLSHSEMNDGQPLRATSLDFKWGIKEAINNVNVAISMSKWTCDQPQCGQVSNPNPHISTTVNVGYPLHSWWLK